MSKKRFNLAIVGATGIVGRALLTLLAERDFPVDELYLLASARSSGETLKFNKHTYEVEPLEGFDFSQVDIALFSAGAAVSKVYAPIAAEQGSIVIDNTSQFRYDEEVPLVIPEVNPQALAGYTQRGIIANPNCSTIQMLVALKPLYDAVGIRRINVATYQSVSGAGRAAFQELIDQSGRLLNGHPIKPPKAIRQQIAFNVIPQIDEFQDNGYTREEMKMVWETHKIFEDTQIQVNPTAVRVPVFYGHSEAIHIQTKAEITPEVAKRLLKKAPGVVLLDRLVSGGYPMPSLQTQERYQDAVLVGRVRQDLTDPCGLNLWVVSDNIRKGAALNTLQIAEMLAEKYLGGESH
ncbi:aspartate-semialdehyde dehydrogenase [Rickettsiella massiliensis]|uniref:aspartate-semialdehyde dehydrogenase n=1 Tax=Rickettsiella massiliensis TaxID=676517 RepID=UPI00029B04B6|nr:aspartate-semialdehyde dehydrogenase [Rickettsiella massiliensis]